MKKDGMLKFSTERDTLGYLYNKCIKRLNGTIFRIFHGNRSGILNVGIRTTVNGMRLDKGSNLENLYCTEYKTHLFNGTKFVIECRKILM